MSDETKVDEPKKALPPMTPEQLAALQHILTDLKAAFPWKWVLALVVSIVTTAGAVKVTQPSPVAPDQWEQAMLDSQTKILAALDSLGKKIDQKPKPLPPGPGPVPDGSLQLSPLEASGTIGVPIVFKSSLDNVTWTTLDGSCTLDAHGPLAAVTPKKGTDFPVIVSQVVDGKEVIRVAMVRMGLGPQPPPGPNPPGPGPNPPTPNPAPIPLDGFRVLIVYDPMTLAAAQEGIVFGKQVRDYLQAKCVVGTDGKTKDFWILQTGSDVANAPKWIGDAIQRRPDRKTFMLISDGKTGYDGPIPADVSTAMTELKKVGG